MTVEVALEAPGLEANDFEVEVRDATARYRHGVLSISLPKIDAPRGRRIAVELH